MRGVIQGDSRPARLHPHARRPDDGRPLPAERMMTFYELADINRAAKDSSEGTHHQAGAAHAALAPSGTIATIGRKPPREPCSGLSGWPFGRLLAAHPFQLSRCCFGVFHASAVARACRQRARLRAIRPRRRPAARRARQGSGHGGADRDLDRVLRRPERRLRLGQRSDRHLRRPLCPHRRHPQRYRAGQHRRQPEGFHRRRPDRLQPSIRAVGSGRRGRPAMVGHQAQPDRPHRGAGRPAAVPHLRRAKARVAWHAAWTRRLRTRAAVANLRHRRSRLWQRERERLQRAQPPGFSAVLPDLLRRGLDLRHAGRLGRRRRLRIRLRAQLVGQGRISLLRSRHHLAVHA